MLRLMVLVLATVAILVSTGCHSEPLKITRIGDRQYEVLGEGSGAATGIMLFNVIPIKQNTRFVRAYQAAVDSVGGDALIDFEIKEQWFWAYVLNGYITRVKGTVVKLK
jgi:hypothetical protein